MGFIAEKLKPTFTALRACKPFEIYRQFGGHFLLDQFVPSREAARERDYTLGGMLATQSVFVHVPKTGGVSVQQAIFGNYGMGHMSIREYEQILHPGYLSRAFVFTVVRNPWDQLFSAYNFLKAGGWSGTRDADYYAMLRDCRSFEHFILDYLGREDIRAIDHFVPALDFLVDSSGEFFPFNFVARYSRLENDYAQLADMFGIDRKLPRLNITQGAGKGGYRQAYTPRMIDTVAEHYGDTIEALGYWFDGHSDTFPALEKAWKRNLRKSHARPSPRLRNAVPDVIAAG